jgi:beta-barrel assembly-enhancing protease
MSNFIQTTACFFILSLAALLNKISAQQDFNNFQILQSVGEIPGDFVTRSSMKVKTDMQENRNDLNYRDKRVFLEGIHYGLDELLQSGMVIYGDEVSNYAKDVAEKLLVNDKELFNRLRFYTIKSTISNALSTDQGIVFVTTGLISQLSSEAELAYILAHEISHYTEKHIIESFEFQTRNGGLKNQIKQLSTYSREKEFEADVLGVAVFAEAGYAKKHITSAFDVLMYSYLPIDETELPDTYFTTELCFVPKNKFPSKKYPIKADESYDDSQSSHPNIQKRKEKAIETAEKLVNWGTTDSFFGQEKFEYIRNLSRFERLRTDMLNFEYANGLYTIFILEKSFPNSIYLNRMKAQCWLGLTTFNEAGNINETINSKSELEGEGAAMHFFIGSLNDQELATLAMRIVEDSRKKFPEDKEINAIWQRVLKNLHGTNAKLSQFSNLTFTQATTIDTAITVDTSQVIMNSDSLKISEMQAVSKYEKIKKKKDETPNPADVDSVYYYNYNLTDLVNNELFVKRFSELENLEEKKEREKQNYTTLKRSERKKIIRDENSTDISEFILVEPAAISYKKGKVNYAGSDDLEEKFTESFVEIADRLNLKMHQIGKGNLDKLGTQGFNEKSIFTSLLIQLSKNNDLEIFPVDYSLLDAIKSKYKTDKLVFSIIEHSYVARFAPRAFALLIFPPAFLSYLPFAFINGNNTEINLIVLDISNSTISNGAHYSFKEPITKNSIQARIYDMLNTINKR